MVRLAHLSDPHLGPLPDVRLRDLASKRVLGYVNWHRNRSGPMSAGCPARVVEAVRAAGADHVAVTGDLVNIALPAELEPARAFLASIGPGHDVTVVPGNHDAYVPGALAKASVVWGPWMRGDADHGEPVWPTLRRRGPLALIGVSTARASGPFMATGVVSVPQATRLGDLLEATGREGLFRVVLIHHPPLRGSTPWHKRLIGGSRVRTAIRRFGAELVLHGHTHLPTRLATAGPDGPVPVIGVSSAAQAPGGHRPAAGYNLFDIAATDGGFAVIQREYRLDAHGHTFALAGEHQWHQPSAARAAVDPQVSPVR